MSEVRKLWDQEEEEDTMKSQQYEEWLFNREELTPEQATELDRALEQSEPLRRMAVSWGSLEFQLLRSEQAEPKPGFTSRWRSQLRARRERRRRRQVGLVLAGSLAGAFFSLSVLGLVAIASPAGLAAGWLASVIRLQQALEAGFHLLSIVGNGLPAIVGGIVLSLTLAWLSLLWFASLYRFAFQNNLNGGR
jgi:hypothetical protein